MTRGTAQRIVRSRPVMLWVWDYRTQSAAVLLDLPTFPFMEAK